MTFGCVLLTMGRRPDELRLALESLRAQEGVETDVAVVGNTWEPSGLPEGVRGVYSAENVGIPAGRNLGVPAVQGELLFFLDDDAALSEPDALARVARRFADDPGLGLLQLRVEPRGGGARARDWVPRLRVGEPARGRATSPRCGRVRWRCDARCSRRSAAGLRTSASSTRASTSRGG